MDFLKGVSLSPKNGKEFYFITLIQFNTINSLPFFTKMNKHTKKMLMVKKKVKNFIFLFRLIEFIL